MSSSSNSVKEVENLFYLNALGSFFLFLVLLLGFFYCWGLFVCLGEGVACLFLIFCFFVFRGVFWGLFFFERIVPEHHPGKKSGFVFFSVLSLAAGL